MKAIYDWLFLYTDGLEEAEWNNLSWEGAGVEVSVLLKLFNLISNNSHIFS